MAYVIPSCTRTRITYIKIFFKPKKSDLFWFLGFVLKIEKEKNNMEKFELLSKKSREKYGCKIKKVLITCDSCSYTWGVSFERRDMILTSDDLTCRNCGASMMHPENKV